MTPTNELSDLVCGKVIRLSWSNGPTKGKTYEHTFHPDGTVEWCAVNDSPAESAPKAPDNAPATPPDRPRYVASKLAPDLCLISYRSQSGHTLTVVMQFKDHSTIAIASNSDNWLPLHGTFEVMG